MDELVYEKDTVDIGEELQKQNSWIGDEIASIYKFPRSPTIKITFSQTILAQKCTERGLKAFNISIPSHEIKLETYIAIKCCMKCYSLESHFTNECPKPKEFKICSECSEEGHVWHQCKTSTKKCINCSENHSTLAMKCVKRKEILKEKRNQQNERQKMTYSNICQKTSPATIPNFQIPSITKEELLQINICVAHAKLKNQENPGSYSYELNRILKANNLPTIIIPEESDTTTESYHVQNVEGAMAIDESYEQPVTGAVSLDTTQQETPVRRHSLSRQSSSSSISVSSESVPTKKLNPKDLGLKFFTTVANGWPTNFSTADLIKGIKNKKLKWTYTNKTFDEEQILRKTERGDIKLSNCFFTVEPDEFRKIRAGLIQVRSPVEQRDPRLKRTNHN